MYARSAAVSWCFAYTRLEPPEPSLNTTPQPASTSKSLMFWLNVQPSPYTAPARSKYAVCPYASCELYVCERSTSNPRAAMAPPSCSNTRLPVLVFAELLFPPPWSWLV